MCGILAVFCNKTPEQLYKILLSAGDDLKKRGPDECGSFVSKNGIYIFRRLRINGLVGGFQPMFSKDGVVMMCNGEIYNHRELQQEFDIKCESESDCEIILHLYQKLGFVEMYKRLDGYFAIVIVDGDDVYLVRDRMGVRPLYIGFTADGFLSACSLPGPLLEFCSGVSHLEPGTCMHHIKTWKMEMLFRDELTLPKIRITNEPEKILHDAVIRAVQKRLMTERPIACLLSGGLDSSIIAAVLCKFLGPNNVRTYSIGLEDSIDLYYAKKVSSFLGTKHTELKFTFREGFDVIPEVIKTLASYDITTIRASVGMYLLAKYISQHTDDRVIFSGEGSDELFCGYLYFHKAPSEEEADVESLRLLREMHQYDILRADRTVSSNGLELRVPFLDRHVVDVSLSLAMIDKVPDPDEKLEKSVLRNAFANYLPEEILKRRKDGFSDGVSSKENSWYKQIQQEVDGIIPDYMFDSTRYASKEAMYYMLIFKSFFPTYALDIPYWMPRWVDVRDPSGRLVEI